MKTLKDTARAGVTLIELLVVILIVTILAVTMLPMFEKYVTKAQYAADAVPTIGHLKTQVDLYMYEHGKIPGLEGRAYGWVDDASGAGYVPKMYELGDDKGAISVVDPSSYSWTDVDGTSYSSATHVATDLEVNTSEGFGKRLRPSHVWYACLRSGGYDKQSNTTSGYGYALGAFGNGDGLKRNTGYAIMELFFPKVLINKDSSGTGGELGYKMLASWQNYAGLNPSTLSKPSGTPADNQILFVTHCTQNGVCPLPDEIMWPGLTHAATDPDPFDNFQTFSSVKTMYTTLRNDCKCGEWEEIEFHDDVK